MSKKTNVFFVATVVLALTLSLTSCGNKSEKVGAGDQTVKLKMFAPNFEKSFPAGVQDDPVMKEITRKTGVVLDITPGNAIADYNSKFAAMLASGDLPDISYVNNGDMYKKIVSGKAALALDPYLEKYGQHMTGERPENIEYSRTKLSVDNNDNNDGKLYFVPLGGIKADPFTPHVGFYLRWDLYEKLGYPVINSWNDYVPILKKMMELEPVNKDGQKNYGISGWLAESGAWGTWAVTTPFQWDAGYASSSVAYTYDCDNDDILASAQDPNSTFWKGIEFWNYAYREGIVDPDAFTNKWSDYLDKKANNNRLLMGWAPWCVSGGQSKFLEQGNSEKGYFSMPSVMKDRKSKLLGWDVPNGNYPFMVSSKTKHPEKAVELLDYLSSWEGTELVYNVIKGVNWDVVDGKPAITDETIKGLKDDPDYKIKTGVMKYNALGGRGMSEVDPQYNSFVNFSFLTNALESRLMPVEKTASAYYNVKYPGEWIIKNKQITISGNTPAYKEYSNLVQPKDVSEIEKTINAKIDNYISPEIIKIILLKSTEEFDKKKAEIMRELVKLDSNKILEVNQQRFRQFKK